MINPKNSIDSKHPKKARKRRQRKKEKNSHSINVSVITFPEDTFIVPNTFSCTIIKCEHAKSFRYKNSKKILNVNKIS